MRKILICSARVLHKLYKTLLSPLLGEHCRFFPTCSDYALESVETHGLLKGCSLAFKRVIRCNPYCAGGVDLVPGCDLPDSNLADSDLPGCNLPDSDLPDSDLPDSVCPASDVKSLTNINPV